VFILTCINIWKSGGNIKPFEKEIIIKIPYGASQEKYFVENLLNQFVHVSK
jgi:hypothetical protein